MHSPNTPYDRKPVGSFLLRDDDDETPVGFPVEDVTVPDDAFETLTFTIQDGEMMPYINNSSYIRDGEKLMGLSYIKKDMGDDRYLSRLGFRKLDARDRDHFKETAKSWSLELVQGTEGIYELRNSALSNGQTFYLRSYPELSTQSNTTWFAYHEKLPMVADGVKDLAPATLRVSLFQVEFHHNDR